MQEDVRVDLMLAQHELQTCLSFGDSSNSAHSRQKEGKKMISKDLSCDNVSFKKERFKKLLPLLFADKQYKEEPMERHSIFF